jgi:tetratricopeptide (TPR) repeat protein
MVAGRPADAEKLNQQATAILGGVYGKNAALEIINASSAAQGKVMTGDLAGALAMDEASLQRIVRVQPNGAVHALVEYGLGVDHALADHAALAYQHYERAYAIFTALGQTDDRVENCVLELARLAIDLGKPQQAVEWSRRGVALAEAGSVLDQSLAQRQLAEALIAANDLAGAREPAEQALALYAKTSAGPKWRGSIRFALAQVLWAAGEHARALDLAHAAMIDARAGIAMLDPHDPLTPVYTRAKQRRIDTMDAWLRTHH